MMEFIIALIIYTLNALYWHDIGRNKTRREYGDKIILAGEVVKAQEKHIQDLYAQREKVKVEDFHTKMFSTNN